jgi:hypothetical protein
MLKMATQLHSKDCRARICEGLWSPGIDSEESMPLAYVAWRAGTTYRVVVTVRQAGNRFLHGLLLKGSTYGLWCLRQQLQYIQDAWQLYPNVSCSQDGSFAKDDKCVQVTQKENMFQG